MLSSWYRKLSPPMRPNPPIRLLYVSYTTFPKSQSLNGTDTSAVALTNSANLL